MSVLKTDGEGGGEGGAPRLGSLKDDLFVDPKSCFFVDKEIFINYKEIGIKIPVEDFDKMTLAELKCLTFEEYETVLKNRFKTVNKLKRCSIIEDGKIIAFSDNV